MTDNNTRYFQWIIYEKNKEVVVFDRIEQEDGINYIVFKNGTRCNEQLIAPLNCKVEELAGKIMAEISSPDNMWTFKEEIVGQQEEVWENNADGEKVCVVPFLPGKKKIIPIPPKPSVSKFGQINNTEQIKQQTVVQEEKKKTFTDDPIWGLLEKAKKVDTEVDMNLTISLPTVNLYNVAKENFENGDEKVIEYIVENIDIEHLKQCIRAAIKAMYENKINETSNG